MVLDNSKPHKIKIYLNPSYDILTIEMDYKKYQNIDIQLINILGVTVSIQKTSASIGINHIYFDTQSMAKGIYTLQIRQDNNLKTQKVVLR